MGIRDMIARCIARMRQGDCATCESRDACVFHKAGAFAPPRASDGALATLLARLSAAVVAAIEPARPVARDVEQRMSGLLEHGGATIDRIASDMGMSRQTLYRRLKEEGTNFDQLLDRLRHRLALRYLNEDRLPVKAVSYRLGFSEPAAFSRAFKRWTGSSPRSARSGT